MEMEFQLSGKLGFAPRVTSILSSIDGAALSHNHYSLRHPADSFHAVFSEVARHFLDLLQSVGPVERTPQSSPPLNEESIRLYKELLASALRYEDSAYEVILAICDKRQPPDRENGFLYKWLDKQGFKAGRLYYSIVKQDMYLFRLVNNALKHSSNCLRPVTVLINSRPCLGYFVESATSDGTIGPSVTSRK